MKASPMLLLILILAPRIVFAESIHTPFVEHGQRQLAQRPLGQRESHLRTLIAEHPGQASLHFHLGNMLAHQRRWPEARQAYAEANALAPAHPDIHYNLGVALDHLERFDEARRHYLAARDNAAWKRHAFAATPLQTRLKRLEEFRQ